MEYEGQICRAPMERGSYMLPVSVGCSYNRCRFCTLFKHLEYRVLPLTQVEEELLRVKRAGGNPKRIFLGDGNAFQLKADHLLQVLALIHRYFPECEAIHMDATVTSIAQKSGQELEQLYRAGVRCLYLGIESGIEDVLQFMDKDHNLAQAYEQIRRIQTLGYDYAAHIMTGVAGRGRGLENARATARFLNETKPRSVTNFSMFLHTKAPLYQEIQSGGFHPSDEREALEEERLLLELLAVEGLEFDGLHDMVPVRIRGKLPQDREKMLEKIDGALHTLEGKEAIYAFVED